MDAFGRVHDYLRISLTERCNLRCTYCMPEDGIPLRPKENFMSREEIFTLASMFVKLGVRKIRLTGGEPLVRKDAHGIISDLGMLGVELAITTNAVLADGFIDTFKNAGLKSINVSLDSLNEEKQNQISRREYFSSVMNNINLLYQMGFRLKINVVVMRGINDNEVADFVELTKNKALHIRFIEFMPFNGNSWDWSKGVGLQDILNYVGDRFGHQAMIRLRDKPNDTARCYKIEGFEGTFGIISSITNPFCDTCNRIRLTADGKIRNCLFSSEEIDLLTALRSGLDVEPLIIRSISEKKASRGGMDSLHDLSNPENLNKNRSMVSIGG